MNEVVRSATTIYFLLSLASTYCSVSTTVILVVLRLTDNFLMIIYLRVKTTLNIQT